MEFQIVIKLNPKLYLRDPEETELGKRIVGNSILLIDELGFEDFTFKKLATRINSTEASIYRYFENKHVLLVYLTSWYWAWLEYRIDYHTRNIGDARDKMKIALKMISESAQDDLSIPHIDESVLHRIVVRESAKAYFNINVDKENKEGFFSNFKSLTAKLSAIIGEINPQYPYPQALASTTIETAHQQLFFSRHLPGLTELSIQQHHNEPLINWLEHLVFGLIEK